METAVDTMPTNPNRTKFLVGGLLILTAVVYLIVTSTIAGAYIMNEVTIAAVSWMLKNNIDPPVFKSANLDGSKEHNNSLRERYSAPRTLW